MPATKGRDRSKMSGQARCIYLDKATDDMLMEMANGHVSAFLRRMVLVEYGREQERKEMAKREGIKV